MTEYQVAMTSIKESLRRRKLTYRDLATQLKLSESGVKKILTAEDGSFQRIVEICTVLGLSITELLAGKNETMREVSYTEFQQEYFLKNPQAFSFYWLLVYERRNIEIAQSLSGINDKDRFSILRKLDQMQLLELLPGDRIRVPSVEQIRWVGGGPLISKIYREWSQQFLRDVAKPEAEVEEHERANQLFLIRYFKMAPRTFHDLMSALKDLETEFVRRATSEMRTEAPDLMHVRWISAVDNRSFVTSKK
jgi:transcriptional regulator with XRE-family HTH domain